MVLKLYVLLGHHTKLTHTKFCDKICHILEVMGTNECARHYKSGFNQGLNSVKRLTSKATFPDMEIIAESGDKLPIGVF